MTRSDGRVDGPRTELERRWVALTRPPARAGRDGLVQVPRTPRRPSPGQTALLGALADYGPGSTAQLARAAEVARGNASKWLRALADWGLIEVTDVVPGQGGHGGGRPAVFYALTPAGREVLGLLRAEEGAA
jgi:hypothetical protein